MTLDELLQATTLDALLLRMYGQPLCAAYHPVLVSQWSKYYFMCFWPCVLQGWPEHSAAWQSVRVTLSDRGLPASMRLLDVGSSSCAEQLLDDHLRPLIERLARYAKVPPGVFWSNAGDALEQALPAFAEARWAHALLTPGEAARPRRDSLQGTVNYTSSGQRRVRACCLACQVPGIGHCAHCPLQD